MPVSVPADSKASSSTTAKAAVRKTSSKWPLTSSLLRLKEASGPRCSLTIAGANKDQRVIAQMPGITSRLAAAVGRAMAAREAKATIGTTGAARNRFLSTLSTGMGLRLRRASEVSRSAYAT
jgi:hypothetical protein